MLVQEMNTAIGGYKCFRHLFQSKIDIRFGIADGLHQCSMYMKCFCSFLEAYEIMYNGTPLYARIKFWMSNNNSAKKQILMIEINQFYKRILLMHFMIGYDHLMRQLEIKPSITLSEPFKLNAETMVKEKIRLLEHLTVNSRRLNGYLVRKHLGTRHYHDHILKITH